MEDSIINIAIEEIEQKNFGVTQQFFQVHKVAYKDGKPEIARVSWSEGEEDAVVFFKVEQEDFYFAVYVNVLPELEVRWVDSFPHFAVYFTGGNKILHADDIISMSTLQPTGYWSKGDKKEISTTTFTKVLTRKFTKVMYEPHPEPYEFKDKITMLLDYVEQDKEGVRRIVKEADGYVQVAAIFHNANTMLGGVHLDAAIMSRLAALGLEIDFDLYADGKLFLDDDDW